MPRATSGNGDKQRGGGFPKGKLNSHQVHAFSIPAFVANRMILILVCCWGYRLQVHRFVQTDLYISLYIPCYCCSVAQSCLTLCNPMDCSMPGFPPCPSPSPGACSNSCPLSRWCHPTILSFVIPFSSCLQSFPASGSFLFFLFLFFFLHQGLFYIP